MLFPQIFSLQLVYFSQNVMITGEKMRKLKKNRGIKFDISAKSAKNYKNFTTSSRFVDFSGMRDQFSVCSRRSPGAKV